MAAAQSVFGIYVYGGAESTQIVYLPPLSLVPFSSTHLHDGL